MVSDPRLNREPCARPCGACPFRRASAPGWLGANSPQDFIVAISTEQPLPCHSSIDYEDEDWQEQWLAGETGKICAGSLILAANMCKSPRDPNFPRKKPDRALVFSGPAEFISHHEDTEVRSWETDESYEKR